MKTEKFLPEVGAHLYLSQRTGDYWVDSVKRPYTVIGVTSKEVKIQRCKLIFHGLRYYDTVADEIEADPAGEIATLHWSPSRGAWILSSCPGDRYPEIAFFGEWVHAPYLN